MRPLQCLAAAVALSSFAAASIQDAHDMMGLGNLLFRRQEEGETTTKATGTTTKATATDADNGSSAPSATSGGSIRSSGGSKATASGTKTTGGSAKGTSNATTTDFDARLPPGGIQMVTPAPIAGSQFYKVGDFVTFAWNYTSLSVTPSAIDILASCSANQATYTLAVNQTVEPTGQIIWDTGDFQKTATIPLLTETYTLLIYDADSSVSATAKAGYLAPYRQYYFGMYTPQPYTPFADFKCPTCIGSGALTQHERQALGVMLGVTGLTILSFTWFAGGMFGLF